MSEEPPGGVAPKAPPEMFPAESGLEPVGPAEGHPTNPVPTSPELVTDGVLSPPLLERMQEADAAQLSSEQRIGIIIELRTGHPEGVKGAGSRVQEFVAEIAPGTPTWITASHTYLTTSLTADQIRTLVQWDAAECAEQGSASMTRTAPRWCIHRIWPNFETRALIHRTIITTKCDATHRSFNALGQDIVWAVMDSGIDGRHRHFRQHGNLDLPDGLEHRTFVAESTDADAMRDNAGHGTHVAGILAGAQSVAQGRAPLLAATWYHDDSGNTRVESQQLRRISGMAPQCRLLSCKVLRDDLTGDVAALLAALEYIQELNNDGRDLRVHGVNLSVGYPFDPSWFAAGLTPVCREVDRLVRSGVVVVIAAGNSGYGSALDQSGRKMRLGFDLTINDPGNAERGITVGSTSWRPHATGISYFSSKGPTGDGRLKPDLVAPGERVVSAGAGDLLKRARQEVAKATYVENSGTSMAAPHVSGVIAGFLSVQREFIGRPDDVKRIMLSSATDLGRARTFQGTGLVDAMRAIQAV